MDPVTKEMMEIVKGYRTRAELIAEIERLRATVEDAIDTLEAMDLHIDNPLYERLCAALKETTP